MMPSLASRGLAVNWGVNMTATLPTTLPATRAITVPRLCAERRAIKLARLAREFIAHPEQWERGAVKILLGAWAADSLSGEALDRAFAEYADAVRLEAGVDDGTVSWQDITQALGGTDHLAAACRITKELVARALAVLVGSDGAAASAAPMATFVVPQQVTQSSLRSPDEDALRRQELAEPGPARVDAASVRSGRPGGSAGRRAGRDGSCPQARGIVRRQCLMSMPDRQRARNGDDYGELI
jgi:hypothetical protein